MGSPFPSCTPPRSLGGPGLSRGVSAGVAGRAATKGKGRASFWNRAAAIANKNQGMRRNVQERDLAYASGGMITLPESLWAAAFLYFLHDEHMVGKVMEDDERRREVFTAKHFQGVLAASMQDETDGFVMRKVGYLDEEVYVNSSRSTIISSCMRVLSCRCRRGDCPLLICHTLPFLLLTGLCVTIQLIFIIYIRREETELDTCVNNAIELRWAGVFSFSAYCASEMAETVRIWAWILRFKTTRRTELLQLYYDRDEIEGENSTAEPAGRGPGRARPRARAGSSCCTRRRYASGVSRTFKLLYTLLLVLPKGTMDVAIWWTGSRFIAKSKSNAELILNCVAILFVLELDDQLYRVTVPATVQDMFSSLPPVGFIHPRTKNAFLQCAVIIRNQGSHWFAIIWICAMTAAVLKISEINKSCGAP